MHVRGSRRKLSSRLSSELPGNGSVGYVFVLSQWAPCRAVPSSLNSPRETDSLDVPAMWKLGEGRPRRGESA